MSDSKEKPKKLQKLKNKYRLVILNDDTFEEKVSLRLSQLNVFVVLGVTLLVLIFMVTTLIVFTPLREFIPGYTDLTLRKKGIENSLKTDSIERVLAQDSIYLKNFKAVMEGNPIDYGAEMIVDTSLNYSHITDQKVQEDSVLRALIESEEKYTLFAFASNTPKNMSNFIFFTPLKGVVTNQLNVKKQHYGVDIAAAKNEAIKAVLEGTVIFAEWTAETGYVIHLQHSDNLVSIYKHNSVLHKEAGDNVKAGEVIAIVGNSGELSTGTHLHFELWHNGIPLNPEEYMAF